MFFLFFYNCVKRFRPSGTGRIYSRYFTGPSSTLDTGSAMRNLASMFRTSKQASRLEVLWLSRLQLCVVTDNVI